MGAGIPRRNEHVMIVTIIIIIIIVAAATMANCSICNHNHNRNSSHTNNAGIDSTNHHAKHQASARNANVRIANAHSCTFIRYPCHPRCERAIGLPYSFPSPRCSTSHCAIIKQHHSPRTPAKKKRFKVRKRR
mmetsp:Transcript_16139/g.44711  ORF Transcript_16139/g.44711 Transcript_16139/m.44711 type:complete len:133 (-) Transcript_16139:1004-1402(-)